MKRSKIAATIILLLLTISAFGSIGHTKAINIVNEVIALYDYEFKSNSFTVTTNILWDNNNINQGMSRHKNEFTLTVYGGMARANFMTEDGFALVVCHEVGHAIGGAPSVKPSNKFSSEGQSDYFASNDCFKRYLKDKDNLNFLIDKKIPTILNTKCDQIFTGENERAICKRTGLAALVKDQLNKNGEVSLHTPDNAIVEFTNFNDYPSRQCRLDTLIAGALNQPRPKCWFNPDTTDLIEVPYNPETVTYEAMFIGTAGKVTKTSYGCHVEVSDIDLFQPAYINGLEEYELKDMGISFYSSCKYKNGDSISGSVTQYGNKLFLNIQSTDL